MAVFVVFNKLSNALGDNECSLVFLQKEGFWNVWPQGRMQPIYEPDHTRQTFTRVFICVVSRHVLLKMSLRFHVECSKIFYI